MSNCVATDYKSFLTFRPKCKACKQPFEQLHWRQQYCKNVECDRKRHTVFQRTFRKKKAGILEVSTL